MLGLAREYARDIKREFTGYNAALFRQDVFAGATVAAVALPLALAFGVGSGADAASGLISAIVSAFVIGGFSGASFQISGPTGAMTAVLIPLAAKFGLSGVLAAGFVSGILLIIAGLCRAGRLVSLLPVPVITGFTSGIAIIIAVGQLEPFLGVKSEGTETLLRVYNIFAHGFNPNPYAVAVGAAVILFLCLWPRKWAVLMPGSLIGILLATIFSSLFDIPVATVGEIPKTLIHEARLTPGSLSAYYSKSVLFAGCSIAILGMIESLLCGIAGGRMKGEKLNGDRELVAQGVGNIILPFLGGVPATAAIARSSVAIKSGCQTRLTGLVQGVILMFSVFLLAPFMSKIPLAALSGVLMVTAWRMNEWHGIRYIFGRKIRGDAAEFLITMSATVLFDLTSAIAAGVAFAVAAFIVRMASIEVDVAKADPADLNESAQIVRVTGPIFFAALGRFEKALHQVDAQTVVFSMEGVSCVDTSGAQMLQEFCGNKKRQGGTVLFASLRPRVLESMNKAGIPEIVGEKAFFAKTADAVQTSSLKTA